MSVAAENFFCYYVRSLKPWVPRRSCSIVNASGISAASDAEERTIIKEHFQGKLEASDGMLADLIVEDRVQQPTKTVVAAMWRNLSEPSRRSRTWYADTLMANAMGQASPG